MNDQADSIIDLREYFRGIWKQVAAWASVGALAAFTFATLSPKWYVAEVSIVPAATSKGTSLPGSVAALGMVDLPFDLGGGADVDRLAAILHSVSVTDAIIAKFNLGAKYREDYLEDTRKALWQHCSTRIDKKSSVLTLSCEDKKPAVALAMASQFADVANQVARRISTSSAAEERRFLETRVAQARADLDTAAVKLREFQEKNKVISLSDQAKAVVSSMATLRAEMLEKQMQLAYVDGFSSNDEATSGGLRRQIGILQSKLKSLESPRTPAALATSTLPQSGKSQGSESRDPGSLFPPAMAVPLLQYQVEQLTREQKIQETVFTMLMQRYETARVNEARDTSTFQVLDYPVLPTKKSRPKRALTTAVGLGVGAVLGVLFAIMRQRKRHVAALMDDRVKTAVAT